MSMTRIVFPPLTCRGDVLAMLDELSRVDLELWARCRTLSDAWLNDPVIPGTWPVLRILAHLAATEAYALACIEQRPDAVARPPEPEGPLDREAVLTDLDEARAATLSFVKSRPEAVLAERCQYGDAGEQTVGGVLYHLIEHIIHHRAFVQFKLEHLRASPYENEYK
jgi:uncharacterized damage-inducible protein DinB